MAKKSNKDSSENQKDQKGSEITGLDKEIVKSDQDEPKKIGRPSTYTPELADRICEQLAQAKSMRTVCLDDDMPAMSTVFKWLRENKEFSEQYARSKAEASDVLVEEMQDIADDARNDWMEAHDKDGESVGYKINGEHVQRSKLRVETRKWIASKLKPKMYGDKLAIGGADDLPPVRSLAETDLDQQIAALQARLKQQ